MNRDEDDNDIGGGVVEGMIDGREESIVWCKSEEDVDGIVVGLISSGGCVFDCSSLS